MATLSFICFSRKTYEERGYGSFRTLEHHSWGKCLVQSSLSARAVVGVGVGAGSAAWQGSRPPAKAFRCYHLPVWGMAGSDGAQVKAIWSPRSWGRIQKTGQEKKKIPLAWGGLCPPPNSRPLRTSEHELTWLKGLRGSNPQIKMRRYRTRVGPETHREKA